MVCGGGPGFGLWLTSGKAGQGMALNDETVSKSAAPARPFARVDPDAIEQAQLAERPILGIRWWILPLSLLLCALQAFLCLYAQAVGNMCLVATQISVIAFAFVFLLALGINPLLRRLRLVVPMNRAEIMVLFAALFVSGGISSFGLIDMLLPMIPAPFTPEWNTPQSGRLSNILPHLNPSLYITDPEVIHQYRVGFGNEPGYWKRIPWGAWAKPFAFWMIFILAMYAMFYAVAMLFFDTWSRREKLVFPLARLPEAALSDEGAENGSLPGMMRGGVFWIGFLFAFLILGYNGCCQAGWLRDVDPIYLGMRPRELNGMLNGTIFQGIADGGFGLAMRLNFTCIGIAFLLPIAISLSIWAYEVIALGLVMMGIWLAFYASSRTVVSNMELQSNFPSSLGGGALFGIALAMIVGLVREKWQASAMETPGIGRTRRFLRALGWGAGVLALSVLITLGWLRWNGVSFLWGSVYTAIVFLLVVGLVRVLAESGIFCQQVHTGPLHLAALAPTPVVPASSLAPMMPAHSALFFDMKCFIGPSIINSFKMEEEVRAQRRRFHLIIIASILVTILVGAVTLLWLAYGPGANLSQDWFFTIGPNTLLDATSHLIHYGGAGQPPGLWIFYLAGAGWAVLSLLMRKRFFWWLNPIGLAMLMNPLTRAYWLSFFVGWVCKKITVSYGGRHSFARIRPFFIGLIFGELLACFLWAVLKYAFSLDYVWIDINLNQ